MENEEKTITEFRPTPLFTVLLYLYFVVLLTLGASSLMHLISYKTNYFIINPNLPAWAVLWDGAISTLIILFGIKAITLSLKGHCCAVSAMRWSLWLCFIYHFNEFYERSGPAGMGYVLVVAFIPLLYTFVFWLYMLKAKAVKEMFPKGNRKKRPWGILGKILFWSYLLWLISVSYVLIEKNNKSKAVPTSFITLSNEEITDGLCVSKPLREWKPMGKGQSGHRYITTGGATINISSDVMNSSDRLAFNEMLGRELLSCGISFGEEISHFDTIMSEKKLYASKYNITNKSDSVTNSYLMCAAFFDDESQKVAMLSVTGDTVSLISKRDILEYMNSVDFDLKNRIVKKNGVK